MSTPYRRPVARPDLEPVRFSQIVASLRDWRTARLYLCLWGVVVVSTAGFVTLRDAPTFHVVLYHLFASGWAFALYITLGFGVVRSSWGNYGRAKEPVQYWTCTAPLILGYLLLIAMPFLTFIPINPG